MSILITGAAGFIGSNFAHLIKQKTNEKIIALDALTYAGNRENINSIEDDQFIFENANICNEEHLKKIFEQYKIKKVIHFAAESHVDRSILSSDPFIQTNIVGTQRLLDVSREFNIERFVHVSTDEVYGESQLDDSSHKTETSVLCPTNPYAATKAAAELIATYVSISFSFTSS